MEILNFLTLLSYVALTTDTLFQIGTIRKNHSSGDLSLIGLSIRQLAILVIFYKFWTLGEWPLVVGQGLLAIAFTLYLTLAFYYCHCKTKVKPKSSKKLR